MEQTVDHEAVLLLLLAVGASVAVERTRTYVLHVAIAAGRLGDLGRNQAQLGGIQVPAGRQAGSGAFSRLLLRSGPVLFLPAAAAAAGIMDGGVVAVRVCNTGRRAGDGLSAGRHVRRANKQLVQAASRPAG